MGHSARGRRGGESRPGWAELAGLRQAVPNLPGSSVNPTCLEKRWSEPAEGADGQLCQADGRLGETVHTRVPPQTSSSVVMEVRSPETMTLEGRRHLLTSNNLFKKVKSDDTSTCLVPSVFQNKERWGERLGPNLLPTDAEVTEMFGLAVLFPCWKCDTRRLKWPRNGLC